MSDDPHPAPPPIPPDDPDRHLTVAHPDDAALAHVGLVGDTYTVVVSGEQTAGRYTVIDMHVPPGGGPAPHRHDFEEAFTVLDGEVRATFRGEERVVCTGETINIPSNAPHSFTNASAQPARLLCVCAPAGQEEFFLEVGIRVGGRTTPPPARTHRRTEAAVPAEGPGARLEVPHRATGALEVDASCIERYGSTDILRDRGTGASTRHGAEDEALPSGFHRGIAPAGGTALGYLLESVGRAMRPVAPVMRTVIGPC